jgi:soluble lytic murein transglycosylase-like protein
LHRQKYGVGLRLSAASWIIAFALFGGATAPAPARADVYEIDDHGGVHVRSDGAAVQWIDPADDTPSAAPDTMPALPESAVTLVADPQVPDAMRAPLQAAAAHYKVSPDLLAALVWQESRWHPQAVSPKGATGLAQLMPATARTLAVDAHDPAANLDGGAHYLRTMLDLFDGDVERALAAYNAGPGRVIRAGGLPRIAETRAYVSTIIDRLSPDLSLGLTQ